MEEEEEEEDVVSRSRCIVSCCACKRFRGLSAISYSTYKMPGLAK